MEQVEVKQRDSGRIHGLDALRAVLMLLGVVLHTMLAYRPPPEGLSNDPTDTTVFAHLIIDAIHVFRMPAFFVISGFFGALLWSKRGSRAMLLNRFQRLVLPLGVFVVLLWPALRFSGTFASGVLSGALDPVERGLAVVSAGSFPPTNTIHLWFLNYLAWITVIVALLVTVLERRGIRAPRLLERVRKVAESPWRSLGWFGALNLLWWYALGWDGLPTSGGWIPDPTLLTYYILCYALGWSLFAAKIDLSSLGERAWTFMAIALVCFLIRFALGVETHDHLPVKGVPQPLHIWLAPTVRTLMACVALITCSRGLAGLFMRYASTGSSGWRYVSDSSYWVYLVHLPLCILVTVLLVGWDVHVAVKSLVAMALVSMIAVATYDLFVRPAFVGRFLNGRRYPRGSLKLGLVASVLLLGGMAHAIVTHEPLEDLPSPWLGGVEAQELLPGQALVFPVAKDDPELPTLTLHRCLGIGLYAICPDGSSFEDAIRGCEALGGGLVVLEEEEEHQALSELLWRLTERPYWIAADDVAVEGRWRWSTGQAITYDLWNDGEPNDWGGGEDCAAANWKGRGWNDMPCGARLHYVCEFSEALRPLETRPSAPSEP